MRILPALLLSGLVAVVAAAPAAPRCAAPEAHDGAAGPLRRDDTDSHDRKAPDGKRDLPPHDEPRLGVAAGPAFKGPEEREHSGGCGAPPPREVSSRDTLGGSLLWAPDGALPCVAPARGAEPARRIERVACRAGRRPLPPPAPLRASRR